MNEPPLISVCIANYNGMEVIDSCLRSVFEQDADLSVEIIVHDDASQDDSAQHIRNEYPQVSLIESDKNVGFCVANNRMADAARGKYLLLLNNDAALHPDALSTLYHEAQKTTQPAILGLPQYDFDTGELLDNGCLLDPFLNPVPNKVLQRQRVGMLMGACLWIDRALWEELGAFPEWFSSIGEDLYLCCRARLAGHSVRALGTSGYRHRVGQSFGGGKIDRGRLATTSRRRSLSERNKTFVLAMTYPAPYMQVLLPLHLMLLLVEGLSLSLLAGRISYFRDIYLPVFPALVRERQRLIRTRREIMRDRQMTARDFFSTTDPTPYKLRMFVRHGLPLIR